MKKQLLKNFLIGLMSLLLFNACNDDSNYEGGPTANKAVSLYVDDSGMVSFEEGAMNEGILVYRNYVDPSVVQVNYTIEEISAQSGVDYVVQSQAGFVDIPSGQASAPILFNFPDNDIGGEERQFRVMINTVSAGYEIDESFGRVSSVIVNIIDDDCDYIIPVSYTAVASIGSDSAPAFNVNLGAASCDALVFDLPSAWGPDFVAWATGDPSYSGQFTYPGTLEYNPADNSVIIESEEFYGTGGGNGSYDPDTQQITYTLTQGLFTSPFEVDVVLTPN